jgi:hypothetical protein
MKSCREDTACTRSFCSLCSEWTVHVCEFIATITQLSNPSSSFKQYNGWGEVRKTKMKRGKWNEMTNKKYAKIPNRPRNCCDEIIVYWISINHEKMIVSRWKAKQMMNKQIPVHPGLNDDCARYRHCQKSAIDSRVHCGDRSLLMWFGMWRRAHDSKVQRSTSGHSTRPRPTEPLIPPGR